MENITGHEMVRGRDGIIAGLYKTDWMVFSEPSWEREMGLQHSCTHILRHWTGTLDQHRQTNRLYRRMRIGAAQRELSRNNGEQFLAPSYIHGILRFTSMEASAAFTESQRLPRQLPRIYLYCALLCLQ